MVLKENFVFYINLNHRAAMTHLESHEPYKQFTWAQLSTVGRMLMIFLKQFEFWNELATPPALFRSRSTFISLCGDHLLNEWVEAMKEDDARKNVPTSILSGAHKSKVDFVLEKAFYDNYALLIKSVLLPSDWHYTRKLSEVFSSNDPLPPQITHITFSGLVSDYPWLLVDCIDWPRMYNRQ